MGARMDGEAAPGPRLGLLETLLGSREPADQLDLLVRAAAEYGPVVRISVANRFLHLLDDPGHIRHVLQSNARNYSKSRNYEPLKLVVGEGLLTSEGRHWRRQRRLVQPAFHRRRLQALATVIVEETETVSARWAGRVGREEALNVADEMTDLTLRAVSRAMLGSDIEGETRKISEAQAFLNRYVDSSMVGSLHLPPYVPTPRNLRFRRALADLDGVVYGIIDGRLARDDAGDDLLGMLLAARDESTGEAMTREQLRDEVATLLLAGHETTANALSWAWYLLAQHPESEKKLHQELDGVLVGRTPTFADLEHLPYTRAVFEETLRLYPPAWAISRRPAEDDLLGGYRIPAGSTVLVSPYVTHRNPGLWERPEAFEPERFLSGGARDRPAYSYFPFGGGPRRCIGEGFAAMEGKLVLATLAQRYRLRLIPGRPVELEPLVTLRPKHGSMHYQRCGERQLAARKPSTARWCLRAARRACGCAYWPEVSKGSRDEPCASSGVPARIVYGRATARTELALHGHVVGAEISLLYGIQTPATGGSLRPRGNPLWSPICCRESLLCCVRLELSRTRRYPPCRAGRYTAISGANEP